MILLYNDVQCFIIVGFDNHLFAMWEDLPKTWQDGRDRNMTSWQTERQIDDGTPGTNSSYILKAKIFENWQLSCWFPGQGGGKVRGARCEVVKCEVPVRGINARRWVICEARMCVAQQTTGTKGVVVGCETLKRN